MREQTASIPKTICCAWEMAGMAWHGRARRGVARQARNGRRGKARQGKARPGRAWQGRHSKNHTASLADRTALKPEIKQAAMVSRQRHDKPGETGPLNQTGVNMQKMTLTEQVLTRTWSATPDNSECWYDRFEEFARVRRVLEAENCPVGADLYAEASQVALFRAGYQMRMPRSTVEEMAA
jgi:hypothetical protein